MIDEPFTQSEREHEERFQNAKERLLANEYEDMDRHGEIQLSSSDYQTGYALVNYQWKLDVETVLTYLLK